MCTNALLVAMCLLDAEAVLLKDAKVPELLQMAIQDMLTNPDYSRYRKAAFGDDLPTTIYLFDNKQGMQGWPEGFTPMSKGFHFRRPSKDQKFNLKEPVASLRLDRYSAKITDMTSPNFIINLANIGTHPDGLNSFPAFSIEYLIRIDKGEERVLSYRLIAQ